MFQKTKKFINDVNEAFKHNFTKSNDPGLDENDYKSLYEGMVERSKNTDLMKNVPAVQLKNVTLYYHQQKGMDDCNMKVMPGDFHILVGNNGAGKSTTMSVITGLNTQYNGQVLLNGLDIKEHPEAKKGLIYILERTNFPSGMTVKSYLMSLASFTDLDHDLVEQKITKGLDFFNIADLANKNPRRLSSGQKKKVFALRALVESPSILVLDEPFANLDPDSRNRLYSMLKSINENGTTVLLSTHILKEVDDLVNSATLIDKGKILFSGPLNGESFQEIYRKHFNNYEFN